MVIMVLRLIIAIIIAIGIGKLVTKVKLPAILGWLLAGMILGPHAFSLLDQTILDISWFQILIHIFECSVGLMIGSELVWKKIKKSGMQIITITLFQSLGTFILVTFVFGLIFYFMKIPLYLAMLFGGIALATAPAPALSIVKEFKTKGPVTDTLIPMAALDDIVGVIVFFTIISIVATSISKAAMPVYMIAVFVFLPLLIGIVTGFGTGVILNKNNFSQYTLLFLISMIILTVGIGLFFNNFVMPQPILNFMLMGMAFSAAFSNMVSSKRLIEIMDCFNPILNISLVIVILNLGAPLDYHLILGAGLFTAVYIFTRAAGKYCGAYCGAKLTKMPSSVRKYLGLTLLPHSGVSLVFTGIAVSVLTVNAPDNAKIIQGTIAAAAVINEVIAVIVAKKGFEWAGEINQKI